MASLSEEIPMKPNKRLSDDDKDKEEECDPSGPYTPDDDDDDDMEGGDDADKGITDDKDDADIDIDIDDEMHVTLGCGILGRYPIISLISFVVAGICTGVGLSFWRPTDETELNNKAVTLQWLGLIGDLFLRLLKCIVLPIVFVNVIIAVVDMMQVGKAGGVGGRTVLLYLCTTIIAGILACFYSAIFNRFYLKGDIEDKQPSFITLGCGTSATDPTTDDTMTPDSFLMQYPNGTLACASDYDNQNDILWEFGDVNSTFLMNDGGNSVLDMSLSDTIYEGVFLTLIPENIFQEFYNANYAAVIVFAIAMGVACAKVLNRLKIHSSDMTFMSLLVELDQILTVMIIWIIMLTPFAVFSLVSATIGGETELGKLFANMGLLIACILLCYITHFLLTYCGGYWLLTKRNPFHYMRYTPPAQLMAFASSSSAATIPLSTECVQSTGLVPDSIIRFVIPLGATVNMDGACIQIVCSCIWLAIYNGFTINVANYILLVIISTFGSMGTAPVPNATLALIVTSYNTVFGTTGTPDGFSYLFAIDWFMDRCSTMLNVTGDMTVCGIVGSMVDIDDRHSVRSSVKKIQQCHHDMFDSASDADGTSHIVRSMRSMKMSSISGEMEA